MNPDASEVMDLDSGVPAWAAHVTVILHLEKKMKEKAEITGDSQPVRYRSICLLSHDPSP